VDAGDPDPPRDQRPDQARGVLRLHDRHDEPRHPAVHAENPQESPTGSTNAMPLVLVPSASSAGAPQVSRRRRSTSEAAASSTPIREPIASFGSVSQPTFRRPDQARATLMRPLS